MNFTQFLGAITYLTIQNMGKGKLSWKTVQEWITAHSNRDNYGAGFSGNALPQGSSNAFAELHKEPIGGRGFKITATVYLEARQGAVASQSWEAKKLDSELEKMFGRNLRVRINV